MMRDMEFHLKVDFADDNGISLIIALDCGIKSLDHVAYARNEISILSSVITIDLEKIARP
jgi:single-stranded DNA-specific DHH superfamily exonuclease